MVVVGSQAALYLMGAEGVNTWPPAGFVIGLGEALPGESATGDDSFLLMIVLSTMEPGEIG